MEEYRKTEKSQEKYEIILKGDKHNREIYSRTENVKIQTRLSSVSFLYQRRRNWAWAHSVLGAFFPISLVWFSPEESEEYQIYKMTLW